VFAERLFQWVRAAIYMYGKGTRRECSSSWRLMNPSQSYGASPAIWDHAVLHATQHRWMLPALLQPGRPVLDLCTRRDGRLSWPRTINLLRYNYLGCSKATKVNQLVQPGLVKMRNGFWRNFADRLTKEKGLRRKWLDFGGDPPDSFADSGSMSTILCHQNIAAALTAACCMAQLWLNG